jgi:hypothetical protein
VVEKRIEGDVSDGEIWVGDLPLGEVFRGPCVDHRDRLTAVESGFKSPGGDLLDRNVKIGETARHVFSLARDD